MRQGMSFQKYRSIENSYRQKTIDKFIWENKTSGVWIVTEKIHGTNFSFWFDGTKMRMAKRTAWIADDANFFGIQKLKDELIEKVKKLYSKIPTATYSCATKKVIPIRNKKDSYIAVFGELFGGNYPHPQVPKNPDAAKVQKGVYYSPHNEFIIYDVKIAGVFVDFDKMQELCTEAELPSVDALFVGTFKECLEYSNSFPSTIRERYDLPKIEDNICEGIVIRPNKTLFLHDHTRVILKNKNERFTEKARVKKEKIKVEMSGLEGDILAAMKSLITENRYDSIVSKIGDVQIKDFGKIQGLFAQDVLEEFTKETLFLDYSNLEKAEQKRLRKLMAYETAILIRNKLLRGE